MRILQVSTSDFAGGAESSAWNLFQAYRQRGHASWLAVGRKVSDDPDVFPILHGECRPAWTRFWRRVQNHASGGRVARLLRLAGFSARLAAPLQAFETLLGREDFDFPGTYRLLRLPPLPAEVVHLHNLHGDYFDLRALPRLSHQGPVIVNLRDAWLLSGHCAHSFGCERWKIGCGHCPDLSIYPAIPRDASAYNWRRKRDIYARSRLYVTAPSQWLMDRVHESMLQGVQYRVIPNAIDVTVFRPGDRDHARHVLDLPPNTRIILLVVHNPFKDLATMEAALGRVNRSNRDENILFICVGRNGVERQLGQGRIRYVGFERDQQRMALFYRASDVYVHAAYGEAFGKTISEAMACGIPVVATAVGGIPEQIEDGKTGILVPPFGVESMAEAIQRLLIDANLHRQIAESAVVHAKKRFGLDRQVGDFLEWYEEVIEDWSRWKEMSYNPQ
jgi:glycosyltransferase involved in cell wall biosynthesis